MTLLMSGWAWIALAAVLAVIEIMIPGYAFLSAAAAMAVTGVLLLTGLWPFGFPVTLVFAAVVSGLVWLVLFRILPDRRGDVRRWREDINEMRTPGQSVGD